MGIKLHEVDQARQILAEMGCCESEEGDYNAPIVLLSFDTFVVFTYTDESFALMVQRLGGRRERKHHNDPALMPYVEREISPRLKIQVIPPHDTKLCKRVPTGNTTTEKRAAIEYKEVEIAEYTWECDPILPAASATTAATSNGADA